VKDTASQGWSSCCCVLLMCFTSHAHYCVSAGICQPLYRSFILLPRNYLRRDFFGFRDFPAGQPFFRGIWANRRISSGSISQ